MGFTIIETLRNAEINLVANAGSTYALHVGARELSTVIVLLEKGYAPSDLIEPLLKKYGDVARVPEKTNINHL